MTKPRLDRVMRREIARGIWSLFALLSDQMTLSFDEGGITIRVGFNEAQDLDGAGLVFGMTRSYEHYEEHPVNIRQP